MEYMRSAADWLKMLLSPAPTVNVPKKETVEKMPTQWESAGSRPYPKDAENPELYGVTSKGKAHNPGDVTTFSQLVKDLVANKGVTNNEDPRYSRELTRANMAAGSNPLMRLGLKNADITWMNIPPDARYTVDGAYFPKSDKIYASPNSNAVAHEALHRGVSRVHDWEGERTLSPNEEELMIRRMMDQMGQAEYGAGAAGDRQILSARKEYTDQERMDILQRYLDQAETLWDARRNEDWSYRGVPSKPDTPTPAKPPTKGKRK